MWSCVNNNNNNKSEFSNKSEIIILSMFHVFGTVVRKLLTRNDK